MGSEVVVIPLVFGSIVAVVWLFQHFALKKRLEAFQTLRHALDKGVELTPETLERMARVGGSPIADLRRGIVFLAIAGAFAAFAAVIGYDARGEMQDLTRGIYGVAMFPLFVGLAFIGLHVLANENKKR